MGLAGLRLGLLAGPAAWLDEIDKTRLPYNVNVLTQASVAFAARHFDVLMEQAGRIREDRATLYRSLSALTMLKVYPSEANFILFSTPSGAATRVFESLRKQGVLIKNLSGQGGPMTDCLRVTVGTPQENQAFLTALTRALGELAA
jgi:histidinol-phosphate aminotransferase